MVKSNPSAIKQHLTKGENVFKDIQAKFQPVMRGKTTAKIGSRCPMDLPAAQDIGEDDRIKETISRTLPTQYQHGIEKAMAQPFKLFLDLLRDGLFQLFELFFGCERNGW